MLVCNAAAIMALAGLAGLAAGTIAPAPAAARTAAAKAAPAPAPAAPRGNPVAQVQVLPSGAFVIGNPAAKIRIVEFSRYTCSHCARFETEGADAIKAALVSKGTGSLEIRSFLSNPVDVAASLLVQCGAPARYPGNHSRIMRSFPQWSARLQSLTPAQQQRWMTGDFPARMRAVAGDMGFYQLMAARGYDRPAIDRCLANQALAQKLAALTSEAANTIGIEGTPAFMINGELQRGVFGWPALEQRLKELTR